jgi:hypothetical protein
MSKKTASASQYQLNPDGSFVINDYNHSKPFSNFFPGVAGIWGIPMWVFYVNRGQGFASFGIESKDRAIVEFQPANKAYRLTTTQGFRTFLKVGSGKNQKFYEPFQNNAASPFKTTQQMTVTSHDLTIEEVNRTLGLKITVNYFTLPEEPYAGLVRRVKIENLSSKTLSIQMIDGLPALIPYGMKDWLCKNMSRTVEAWVKVTNVGKKAPYYQLNVEVADTPQVTHISEGNFYFAFDAAGKLLDPIVDPVGVFGHATDFLIPEEFLKKDKFSVPQEQFTSNRTPSALSHAQFSLKGRGSKEFISIVGFAHEIGELNRVVKQAVKRSFIDDKARRNKELIEEIKQMCFTASSSTAFNHYCGQTFLDNVLRGGLPVSLKTAGGAVAFNVYSRKHGDLERDYNFFMLAPTYLSQGNGNFRDVNQNRRNDVWFNADVKDTAIVNFFSLSQADGYNPLIVRGMMFSTHDSKTAGELVERNIEGAQSEKIKELLINGFMPGELLRAISKHELKLKCSPIDFLTNVLGHCQKQELSDHGEGFWSDHWTYNIDLLESYLAVYPEQLREVLIDKKAFSFFFNNHYVLPRDQRYMLTKYGVRQYHSVVEKEGETQAKKKGFKLRVKNGQGEVYHTTLMAKMLCLIANKAATLDPSGIGIEMEGDKPNWYDALNGLPGLLGSSISETFELKRYAQFLLTALADLKLNGQDTVMVFEELEQLIRELTRALADADPLNYWKKSNDAKEAYRKSIRLGISGEEKGIAIEDIKKFLNLIVAKTNQGVEKARNGNDLFATYFYHEVLDHETLPQRHHDGPFVRPLSFKRHDLPYFLEGFVHALKSTTREQAQTLYQSIKKSKLYDKKLGMYKVNTDLSSESEEIGRTRIFPSGWLENESIWLHMEYKYLLEILRNGLSQEFYTEIKSALVPFLDPNVYGRSILENSSFIASSAHKDARLHGQGFVARLSGSTAEFLHMWLIMNMGKRPFRLHQGKLALHLEPVLPADFFIKTPSAFEYMTAHKKSVTLTLPAHTYAFNMIGKMLVVYHNPRRLNTFGPNRAIAQKFELHYAGRSRPVAVTGSMLDDVYARDVRDHKVERIDVHLG